MDTVTSHPSTPRRRATRPAGSPEKSPQPDAAATDDAVTPESGARTPDEPPARRRRGKSAAAAAVLLVLVLLGATAWILVTDHRTTQDAAQRVRLLAGARQTALNMTTLQADSAKEDVDRLLAGASGDFLAQFQDRQSDFVDVVGQAGVNSTGAVVSAGIESTDGACAVTLVAADAQVSNVEQTEPTPRSFRFRITMCDNDGAVTATAVDFVP